MKLGTMLVGGKCDGQTYPMRIPRMEAEGETYMLVSFRDKDGEHFFYQLAGMAPAEAHKTWMNRHRVGKGLGQ